MTVDLATLIEQRQTRRDFSNGVSDGALGEFLWLTCRNRSSRPSPYGFNQESRAHPSAGAVHPIHVLVGREGASWARYDPTEHALVTLPGSEDNLAAVRDQANQLLELQQGLVLGLAAEPGKSAAKYENSETLVWRDAGVVLGYMSLIAEALQLAFCPLGISGNPSLSSILHGRSDLFGAGLAILAA
ncbi:MAG: nitroreductase family protein [Steroidobacteraceae bacterium]|nr:nitroreductase family protein [Steroidobacteraceae bacterium]